MLKNYITIAIRNLARHKVYTFINIIGLAIGLACSTLILLYLQREFSFDQHHSKADRIHYVFTENRESNGNWTGLHTTPAPVAPALEEEFPEVERATRFARRGVFVHVEGKDPVQSQTMVVDQAFFDVFDFPLEQGDAQTYLQTPFSIVVTESFAHTLFGDENPIGKTIRLDAKFFDDYYTITGILKDVPATCSFKPDLMTATVPQKDDNLLKRSWESWRSLRFTHTYVLLKQGASISALEKKLPAFIDRHLEEERAKTRRYAMMPLAQYHFVGSHLIPRLESGNINDCYTLGAIGISIVVVACINFMNLSTARSTRRMREVGMRKVVGAKRVQLVCQFLGESILLSLLALMISLGIAELTLPMLNGFMGINLSLNPSMLPALFLLSLVVGLLAGSYPAFFLSSFRPTSVLKVMPNTKGGHALVRKGLVVVQFAISMVLIAGTIIVSQQTEFMRSADMGFQKASLIRLPTLWQNAGEIKTQLLQHAGVRQVTSAHVPPFAIQNRDRFSVAVQGSTTPIKMPFLMVDHDFIETFQIPLLSGRNFMPQDLRAWEGPRNASYKVLLFEILQTSQIKLFRKVHDLALNLL
jgi:putative ABC transport system permease protein